MGLFGGGLGNFLGPALGSLAGGALAPYLGGTPWMGSTLGGMAGGYFGGSNKPLAMGLGALSGFAQSPYAPWAGGTTMAAPAMGGGMGGYGTPNWNMNQIWTMLENPQNPMQARALPYKQGGLSPMSGSGGGFGGALGSLFGGGGGGGLGQAAKGALTNYGPAAAMMGYGAYKQSKMSQDFAQAQEKAYKAERENYDKYLKTINPPESVKAARYGELKGQIQQTGRGAQRQLGNVLAARGIKGRGLASPNAALQRNIASDLNQAYNQVYGAYNVPNQPAPSPPVNYAQGWGDILGANLGDLGGLLLMRRLFG